MDSSSSSHYVKTVVLREWWLVPSPKEFEGKRVAVSGFPADERAVRLFTSAPVVKRHSVVKLETSDGVFVILDGFINKMRTEQGGFSPEVFKFFVYGFPLNWEDFAGRKLGDDECPSPVLSPKKTTRNGCAATVVATKASRYVPAEEATDVRSFGSEVSVSVEEGLESPSNLFSRTVLPGSRYGGATGVPIRPFRIGQETIYNSVAIASQFEYETELWGEMNHRQQFWTRGGGDSNRLGFVKKKMMNSNH